MVGYLGRAVLRKYSLPAQKIASRQSAPRPQASLQQTNQNDDICLPEDASL
jgi:hypothetical protein